MRPFLLIQTRSDDDVQADELRSTTELSGFGDGELEVLRLEQAVASGDGLDWEEILEAHSGIILGGSPFNATDSDEKKTDLQRACEAELRRMLDAVTARDYPFLGACYGVSTLGLHQGGVVDRTYGEPASAVTVTVTEEGAADPLLAGLPGQFEAFVGHKEAMKTLPENAVLLVRGQGCPVQMFRIGQNMYATQFHPELDIEGLAFRLRKYANEGYVAPGELESAIETIRATSVLEPRRILQNFRTRYSAV